MDSLRINKALCVARFYHKCNKRNVRVGIESTNCLSRESSFSCCFLEAIRDIWSKLALKACYYYNSLWPNTHTLLRCSLSSEIVVDPHHTVFKASYCQNLFTLHQGSNMICFVAFVREINNMGSSPEMRSSLQESSKRHGIIYNIVLSIKFHNKSWAALGCQIIFRWSSAN